MQSMLFVMAIMGCGESDAPCREVRVLDTPYRTEAICLAATEAVLMRNSDLSYPTIVAQCRPAAARARRLRADEVLLPPAAPARPARYASR